MLCDEFTIGENNPFKRGRDRDNVPKIKVVTSKKWGGDKNPPKKFTLQHVDHRNEAADS